MSNDKQVKVQFEVDGVTGKITKTLIDRNLSGNFEEVELDAEALIALLKGGEAGKDILANRTGPDPRRLPP